MNKRKKALLLSSIAALSILCGCGSKKETVEVDGETYIKNEEEYTKVEVGDRIFEPGTHIIHYIDIPASAYYPVGGKLIEQGFDNAAFYVDNVPEGYKLVGVTSYSNSSGNDYYIVYVFVNEVPVIAKGRYDVNFNEVVYETPGKIVVDTALTLEP